MKYFELSSKSRPSPHWIKFAAASLMAIAIAGCGGGGTGANSTTTPATNPAAVAKMAAASWQSLKPQIDKASITVSIPADGKPVVTFKVTDELGNPVIGLGGQIAGTATALPTNYNLQFTLAKFLPPTVDSKGLQTNPGKWVSYLVTKPGTITAGAVATWAGTFPTSDTNGTLVDNNDGTYKYTFLRDITAVQAQVNALTDTATNFKADLDPANLAYDASATTRLGILIVGSQPGTGTNTPTKVQSTNPIPLVNTFNIGYDFVPAGGAVTATRDIVVKDSCSDCHDGRAIGHISVKGTSSLTASPVNTVNGPVYGVPNGIPAGSYVGRNDPRLCVTCHTDQTKYSFAEVTKGTNADGSPNYSGTYGRINGQAAFTFPRMIHQFHMGGKLVISGYNLNNHCNPTAGTGLAECFNNNGLPQSPADCTKCHDGNATKSDGSVNTKQTANGNVWKTSPSVIACGACHDGIDFATGAGITLADKAKDLAAKVAVGTTKSGHLAGIGATTDAQCAGCHAEAGANALSATSNIPLVHRTNTATLNNPDVPAGVFNMAYSIKSVTVNASKQPVITFQIKKDGVAVTALNVPTPVINGANGQTVVSSSFEPITGLVSGPTFYVAFAVPQDGITAPADFNASASVSLANLLVASGSPKAGSLSNTVTNGAYQADASGYFTATLTGNLVGEAKGTCTAPTAPATATCVTSAVLVSPIVIPTGATIVTGAMIGTFTQTNLAAYAYTAADPTKNANVSAKGGLVRNAVLQKMGAAGVAPRRTITATAKCAACHEQLGTDPSFHGGARNDPTACDICHNANKTSSGWSANASTFIHGIHGSSKRSVPFMWTAVSATDNYSKIGYPGLLKDCNQCHLPNTVNFGANGGTALTPNLLWPTAAAGTISTTSSTWRNSPYATAGVNYGNFFAYTPEGSTVAAYTPATAGLPTATAGVVTVAGTAVAAHVAGVGGESVVADPATLVNSPISSACFACHDTANAQTHIRSNGGKLYEPRANVTSGGKFVNGEDCLTCHGAGRIADVAIMHKK